MCGFFRVRLHLGPLQRIWYKSPRCRTGTLKDVFRELWEFETDWLMAILVTGGAGFIGSHFIERLLEVTDEQIICLDNFNDYYDPSRKRSNVAAFAGQPRVSLVEADFCDQRAIAELFGQEQIDHVVHLGAYAGVRYSVDHPLIYQQTNVCGTLNLLEAARKHPVRRFLLASSSTVYGAGATAPFAEDAPLGSPMSPYGASKRAAELLGETYFHLHGVPVVSLRLFSVYGPRLRPDLAMTIFTQRIAAGETLPLYGDGSIRRDFTHVRDVCSGLLAAMSADDAAGQAINLGHDEPIDIRRLIDMLEQRIGKLAQIDRRPERPEDLPLTHANISKARRLLAYEPNVPFDEGLTEFVEWFLKGSRVEG